MAGVYNSDQQRAQGGDRGWITRKDLREEITSAAFALKAGQHSGVIEVPEFCYVVMVEEARPAHIRPEAEMRDEIERILSAKESQKLYRQWIERLKRKSFIEYY
jgi:parvulin-like peptidyl-prolyl isomerase